MAENFGLNLADYDFDLPEYLIAQHPASKRDSSKLLIYDRKQDQILHKNFSDISQYFSPKDALILNNSKVIPAKLIGTHYSPYFQEGVRGSFLKSREELPQPPILKSVETEEKTKKIEIVLVEELAFGSDFIEFSVITRISKLKINQVFEFPENVRAEFVRRIGDLAIFRFSFGECGFGSAQPPSSSATTRSLSGAEGNIYLAALKTKQQFYSFLDKHGKMPLPPYIKRENDFLDTNDKNTYQTVYAKNLGSIAAPTAGLHFTDDVLGKIVGNGTLVEYITLHVGMGTFKPIKTENIKEHKMLPERYEISDEIINLLQNKTRNITSVGTTTTRTIESFMLNGRNKGETDLYINPGHKFRIDRLLTNFHVPKSTPLMLLTAFIADGLRDNGEQNYIPKSVEILKKIYAEAIKKEYRFYSYGDSMFVI